MVKRFLFCFVSFSTQNSLLLIKKKSANQNRRVRPACWLAVASALIFPESHRSYLFHKHDYSDLDEAPAAPNFCLARRAKANSEREKLNGKMDVGSTSQWACRSPCTHWLFKKYVSHWWICVYEIKADFCVEKWIKLKMTEKIFYFTIKCFI